MEPFSPLGLILIFIWMISSVWLGWFFGSTLLHPVLKRDILYSLIAILLGPITLILIGISLGIIWLALLIGEWNLK